MDAKIIDILLVEDSPGDVRLTREALREYKILNNLHVAVDGVEALDFLYKRGKHENAITPDIIILDLNLPRKDGREVLEEIKNDPKLKSIPVVILSTSDDDRDVVKAYKNHANCYITKPVDLEQFIKVVKSFQSFWLSIVKLPGQDKEKQ